MTLNCVTGTRPSSKSWPWHGATWSPSRGIWTWSAPSGTMPSNKSNVLPRRSGGPKPFGSTASSGPYPPSCPSPPDSAASRPRRRRSPMPCEVRFRPLSNCLPPALSNSWSSCRSSSPRRSSPRPRHPTSRSWPTSSAGLWPRRAPCRSRRPLHVPPGCRSPSRTRSLSPGRLLPSGRRPLLPSRRRLRLRPLMPHWPPYWSGSRRSPKAVRTRLHTRSTSSFSASTVRTSAPSRSPRFGISGPGSAAMHPVCPASRTSGAPSSPAPLLFSRLLTVQPPPQPKPQPPTRHRARPKRRGIRPKKLIRRPSQRPCGSAGKKSTIRRREKSTQDSSEASSGINLAPACRPFRTNNSTIRPSSRLSESDPLSMTEACD